MLRKISTKILVEDRREETEDDFQVLERETLSNIYSFFKAWHLSTRSSLHSIDLCCELFHAF